MPWLLRSLSMLRSNDPKTPKFYFPKVRFPVIKSGPGKLLCNTSLVLKKEILFERCLRVGTFPMAGKFIAFVQHKSHTTNASRYHSDHKMRNM